MTRAAAPCTGGAKNSSPIPIGATTFSSTSTSTATTAPVSAPATRPAGPAPSRTCSSCRASWRAPAPSRNPRASPVRRRHNGPTEKAMRRVPLREAAFLVLALLPHAHAQIPGLPSAQSTNSPKPASSDPLDRETPYGCVIGFLRAAERGDFFRAADYLEMPRSADAVERARQLRAVLNPGPSFDIESFSKLPEGDLKDGLPI